MTTLALTYADIRRELGAYAGWGRDPSTWPSDTASDAVAVIKDGLVSFYTANDPDEPKRTHRWSFLYPVDDFTTTAPYSTGTVAIVNGVVTLTGGTFPANAADGELTVNGVTYTVNTRDSNTQLTLDDLTVDADAGTGYSLVFPFYALPADFGRLEGDLTLRPGASVYSRPIKLRSEQQLRAMRQARDWTSQPVYCALRPKPHTEGSQQTFELMLYPTPDAVYTIERRYMVVPNLLDATNTIPPGGVQFTQAILASVLAAFERRFVDRAQWVWHDHYKDELRKALAVDRDLNSPDYLGQMRGGGDGPPPGYEFRSPDHIISINGTQYIP